MRTSTIGNWAWRGVAIAASLLALVLGLRILQSERQPDLEPWHTWAPPRSAGRRDRGLRLAGLAGARGRADERPARAHGRDARGQGPRAGQPLLRGQPVVCRALRARLESLLRVAARRTAGGRGGAVARPVGFTLFTAPRGAGLCRAWLRGHRAAAARAWHRARGTHARALAGLARGHPARHARGAARRGTGQAAAHRGVFERRRAGAAIRAGLRFRAPGSRCPHAWCWCRR
jgi:hypothetical protein